MSDCTRYRALLMGLMDDELTADEATDVHEHLSRCGGCQDEYDSLRQSLGALDGAAFCEPAEDVLATFWRNPYQRVGQQAALWMMIGGYLLLIGYGIATFMRDGAVPAVPKLGFAAIGIGAAVLLLQVLTARLRVVKDDPYREVKR
jgi:anti-sigma factor RsiW